MDNHRKRYRILHVINSLTRAGTERQLILNLSALNREKFDNHLIYFVPPHSLLEEAISYGVHPFYLNLQGKRSWIPSILKLTKYIKQNNISLVHTNLFESDVIGGMAAKLAGIPAISTLASPASATVPFISELKVKKYKLSVANYIHKLTYRLCHEHFIAVSDHVRNTFEETLKKKKSCITTIPRCVSKDFMQLISPSAIADFRKKIADENTYPLMLNVGRLIPQKGQKYILEAMPHILKSFPNAKLLIAGEGSFRNELEMTCKTLAINHKVSFLGNCDNIKELHLASDIFIFPSLSEGMPGALLEAAALGKPCVASDIDPVKEIIVNERSGILIPKKSPDALAQAVISLSISQERAISLGIRARESVIRRNLIENVITNLENLYVDIIERNRN